MKHYTISDDGENITCHRCHRTSHNINDVNERYCGFCHMWLDDEHGDMPPSTCPVCGYVTDSASLTTKDGPYKPPDPGDFSICLKCGEIMVFGPDLILSTPTIDQLLKLHDDQQRYLDHIQKLIRKERLIK